MSRRCWVRVSEYACGREPKESPDAADELALEAAERFAVGLAFGLLALDVGDRFGVAAGARDGDAVNCGVDLTVAAAIEAVAVSAS